VDKIVDKQLFTVEGLWISGELSTAPSYPQKFPQVYPQILPLLSTGLSTGNIRVFVNTKHIRLGVLTVVHKRGRLSTDFCG
jgi:hypothetical protein